ncbi:MAG: ABC transporter permease [Chloroflexota bacterium]|nr:ABC transporter permease [Chloroflexota bacterium]
MAIDAELRQENLANSPVEKLRTFYKKLSELPVLWVSILLVVLVIPAIFAPIIAPHDPYEGDIANRLDVPVWYEGGSWDHILGTDRQGRDLLSRLIYGSRIAMFVSMTALLISATIGTTLGLLSGWYGGWIDHVIQRLVDIKSSIPAILLALIFVSIFGPSIFIAISIIAIFLWNRYTRLIRAETLSLRNQDFVARAKVSGASTTRIISKHILPNVGNTLIVLATLEVGTVIILESTLSFLGVGIPRPIPAWGVMVSDGRNYLAVAWWIAILPGVGIFLTVLSLNLFGDWLRDHLDPKLRQVRRS